jgi:hypothetical protein
MAIGTFPGMLQEGTHAARPAATAVGSGALYACSDHALIYQSDGASWSTWAALGGGAPAAHAASHENGGSDEIDVTGLVGAGGGGGGSALTLDATAAGGVGSGDLFTGTSLDGGWSSLQSTALDTVDRSQDGYLILGNNSAMGTDVFRGLDRAFSPAGDFTIWARVEDVRAADFIGVAILAGATDPSDGGSGNRIQASIYHSSGNIRAQLGKFAAGSKTLVFDAGSTTAMPIHAQWSGHPFPVWLGLRRVGSTLSMGFSQNGVKLRWHATTTTISFTVNTVGIAILNQGSNDTESAVVDYIATAG